MPPTRNTRSSRPSGGPADRPRRPSRPNSGNPRTASGPSRPSHTADARPGGPKHGNHPGPRRQLASDRAIPDMDPINVEIDRIVGDGKGIGFLDGRTVFVSRTAPGDFVRARVMRKQGKIYHADLLEILTPSPMRIDPRVADYDASGGLDLQHIGYDHQLRVKAGMIEDSLRRIARLDPMPEVVVTASSQEWGYRSRAEFQIDHRNGAVGYFASQSHRVVDVEESPILTPEVQVLLTTLRDDVAAGLVPTAAREYRAVQGDTGSVLEPTATARSRMVMRTVGGELFRFSAECFFQANIPIAEKIMSHVIRIADEAALSPGLALDLYCGVGLFTVPLARRFKQTIGVESFAAATKYAEENVHHAGEKARIVTAPVEQWLAGDRSPLGRVALAVFDPPRTGAGPEVINALIHLKPAHIAAVSCDPATFARDIRGLLDGGYELVDVQGYDMFPQTHHVELVGHLRHIDS